MTRKNVKASADQVVTGMCMGVVRAGRTNLALTVCTHSVHSQCALTVCTHSHARFTGPSYSRRWRDVASRCIDAKPVVSIVQVNARVNGIVVSSFALNRPNLTELLG